VAENVNVLSSLAGDVTLLGEVETVIANARHVENASCHRTILVSMMLPIKRFHDTE